MTLSLFGNSTFSDKISKFFSLASTLFIQCFFILFNSSEEMLPYKTINFPLFTLMLLSWSISKFIH